MENALNSQIAEVTRCREEYASLFQQFVLANQLADERDAITRQQILHLKGENEMLVQTLYELKAALKANKLTRRRFEKDVEMLESTAALLEGREAQLLAKVEEMDRSNALLIEKNESLEMKVSEMISKEAHVKVVSRCERLEELLKDETVPKETHERLQLRCKSLEEKLANEVVSKESFDRLSERYAELQRRIENEMVTVDDFKLVVSEREKLQQRIDNEMVSMAEFRKLQGLLDNAIEDKRLGDETCRILKEGQDDILKSKLEADARAASLKERVDKSELELREYHSRENDSKVTISELRNELEKLHEERSYTAERLLAMETSKAAFLTQIGNLKQTLRQEADMKNKLTIANNEAESLLRAALSKCEILEARCLDDQRRHFNELTSSLSRLSSIESERDSLKAQLMDRESQISILKSEAIQHREEIETLETKSSQMEKKLSETINICYDYQKKLESQRAEIESQKRQIEEIYNALVVSDVPAQHQENVIESVDDSTLAYPFSDRIVRHSQGVRQRHRDFQNHHMQGRSRFNHDMEGNDAGSMHRKNYDNDNGISPSKQYSSSLDYNKTNSDTSAPQSNNSTRVAPPPATNASEGTITFSNRHTIHHHHNQIALSPDSNASTQTNNLFATHDVEPSPVLGVLGVSGVSALTDSMGKSMSNTSSSHIHICEHSDTTTNPSFLRGMLSMPTPTQLRSLDRECEEGYRECEERVREGDVEDHEEEEGEREGGMEESNRQVAVSHDDHADTKDIESGEEGDDGGADFNDSDEEEDKEDDEEEGDEGNDGEEVGGGDGHDHLTFGNLRGSNDSNIATKDVGVQMDEDVNVKSLIGLTQQKPKKSRKTKKAKKKSTTKGKNVTPSSQATAAAAQFSSPKRHPPVPILSKRKSLVTKGGSKSMTASGTVSTPCNAAIVAISDSTADQANHPRNDGEEIER